MNKFTKGSIAVQESTQLPFISKPNEKSKNTCSLYVASDRVNPNHWKGGKGYKKQLFLQSRDLPLVFLQTREVGSTWAGVRKRLGGAGRSGAMPKAPAGGHRFQDALMSVKSEKSAKDKS